jgi:hypothetical protein
MMSEHHKHTEFLKQCLLYDDSSERHRLAENLSRAQRDLHCVQRAMWLMAVVTALTVAGLGYEEVLVDNFPYDASLSVTNIICATGAGSLVCLLAFAGLGMVYGRKVGQRREECRQMVTKLLESRLGKPVTGPPLPDAQNNRIGGREGRTARVDNEVKGSQLKIQSTSRG